jgi:chaperonin GroEL (HSP60 family)
MSLFQVNKPKSASKIMVPVGAKLSKEVSETLKHISLMVGATLGPGGRAILIERPEIGMKPIISKDGVTIIKQLGYESATKQLILEAVRDAAQRTASEAGDGTTTATILSESICRGTEQAISEHPKISPQKIVREMQDMVPDVLTRLSYYKVESKSPDEQRDFLMRVATISANGDKYLASTILEALDSVGDEGNITIIEVPGPSKYEVEKISGYTIETGYDESCGNFSNGFINDKTGTAVILEKPLIVLFDGVINDIGQIVDPLNKIGQYFIENRAAWQSVVIVAHAFSNSVIGDLHLNWNKENTFKSYPLSLRVTLCLTLRQSFCTICNLILECQSITL